MLYLANGQQHTPGMLQTCLDETGKWKDKHLAFAGWISDGQRWEVFQQEWARVFAGFVGVTSIHMSELMRPESAIRYQDHTFREDRPRELLIERCIEVVQKNTLEVVACGVDCDAYNTVLSSTSKKRIGRDAHVFVFRRVMKHIVDRLGDIGWPYPTSLIFDDNRGYGSTCYELYSNARESRPEWRKKLGSICFVDDEIYPPVQAADMLAWLTRRQHLPRYRGEFDSYIDRLTAGKTRDTFYYTENSLRELEAALSDKGSVFDHH